MASHGACKVAAADNLPQSVERDGSVTEIAPPSTEDQPFFTQGRRAIEVAKQPRDLPQCDEGVGGARLIPAAFSLTRTCPGSGVGWATSTTRRTSIPPYSSNLTALGMWL